MLSKIMRNATFGAAYAVMSAAPAFAAATDYKFEVVTAQPAGPQKTDVTVRLVHATDNKPVADAVIFEIHADMGPEGMPTMPGAVTALRAALRALTRNLSRGGALVARGRAAA